MKIAQSDLIINPDGSIYHLNLLPGDVAETVITVGDPDRVSQVSKHFDTIELKKGKREFITHTGFVGKKRVTVLSTGIGTDNIDIVLNELDALVNIDFNARQIKQELTSLNIVRIGTSGSVQPDIPMGTILASAYGLGMDALMNYYLPPELNSNAALLEEIKVHFKGFQKINPYLNAADENLLNTIGKDLPTGITVTAPGFYAPQGRLVRAQNAVPHFINLVSSFKSNQYRITNLEMETAGIYALANVLGHKALSINAILASRVNFQFSSEPDKVVENAIKLVLERL
ncbi:nucleoside phosphorylase [Pedobacter endophyticus]|uniref:Uridine phosphorylase n=1 Tax=Pedobacter endophyticus TaxID=2789740 RepID=A0A7S9L0J9_9SPHI|nr:nucleoside phosphorylase [Pedobacter endophyticus]QPH40284.1 nucleoside phosphorylase [Pedobacter endophyticus]